MTATIGPEILCEGAVGTKPRPYKDLIITSDRLFKVS